MVRGMEKEDKEHERRGRKEGAKGRKEEEERK